MVLEEEGDGMRLAEGLLKWALLDHANRHAYDAVTSTKETLIDTS